MPEGLRLVLRAARPRAARQVRADARRRSPCFRSSEPTERGFCRDCGTPLTFRYLDKERINIALGSLDDPAQIPPQHQYGVESRLSWFDTLVALPGETTTEEDEPDLAGRIAATSHQHPDHDTAVWPPDRAGTRMTEIRVTGGCQCGAVRYALHAAPSEPAPLPLPHVPEGRSARIFAPLTGVATDNFEVTRGAPAIFRSSDLAERGFCRDCGTPLTFARSTAAFIAVSIGSLDEPERVPPLNQSGRREPHAVGRDARDACPARRPPRTRSRPSRPGSPRPATSTPTTTPPSGRREGKAP